MSNEGGVVLAGLVPVGVVAGEFVPDGSVPDGVVGAVGGDGLTVGGSAGAGVLSAARCTATIRVTRVLAASCATTATVFDPECSGIPGAVHAATLWIVPDHP